MDPQRFDALARALGRLGSRRHTLAALMASTFGLRALGSPGLSEDVAAKKKKRKNKKKREKVKGPCARGKSKKNSCRKANQCCTGICQKKRCRCKSLNQSCSEGRNCCPEQTNLGCFGGTCQPCDVCASGCSFSDIQAAISAANPGDTIQLCAGTFGSILNIDKNVTLIGVGDGTDGTILDGQQSGRVMIVAPGATVDLQDLRITGGSAGGILNYSTLTLTNSTVTGNTAGEGGGGIRNNSSATLTITNSTVSENSAVDGGGGILNGTGTLTLTNSSVTGNTAGEVGGGILNTGSLTLINSTVSGNESGAEAGEGGGGIYNSGSAALTGSSVTANTAGQDGGGIYNNESGTLTLTNSSVTNNTAGDDGGGIFNLFTLTLIGTNTIADNDPDDCVDIAPGTGCP